jgi:Holliday junction resolvase RusA-like endonuclease
MVFKAWAKSKILRRHSRIPPKKRNILAGLDPRLKQKAFDKLSILREYQRRLSNRGFKKKKEVIKTFLVDFNSGMLWPDEKKSIRHISRSSLYGWKNLYGDGGIAALVPHYCSVKKGTSPGAAIFKSLRIPFEIKFPGPPRRNGKAHFCKRARRHWKYPAFDCPISLAVFYSMAVPKGAKMPRRMKMLKGKIVHTGKPCIDVLNAFIMDCLKGIVFKSYNQVVRFHSEKSYGWWPQTRVLIQAVPGWE